MRVLYAIQGTGNGHITRAREVLPALQNRVQVDVLVSGMHSEVDLGFPIRHRAKGLGFKFGKRGGVDYLNTWWHGDVPRFFKEIERLDLRPYDLVINDFEPVSAWAAKRQHVPCVGMSNQCTLLDPRVPKPDVSRLERAGHSILKHYAPVDVAYGFHYHALEPFIHTPVIRRELRDLVPANGGYYLVYLPFYADAKIIKALQQFKDEHWVVFSKHSKLAYRHGHIDVMPVNGSTFTERFANCQGVLCAAGFGITTEALFLGKKLLVVPMKKQYEQACNAHTLSLYGVPFIKSLKAKWHPVVRRWLATSAMVQVHYPDNAQYLVDHVLSDFANQKSLMAEAAEIRMSKGG